MTAKVNMPVAVSSLTDITELVIRLLYHRATNGGSRKTLLRPMTLNSKPKCVATFCSVVAAAKSTVSPSKPLEEYGGGKVTTVEEAQYAGSNGALKIVFYMPEEFWKNSKVVARRSSRA